VWTGKDLLTFRKTVLPVSTISDSKGRNPLIIYQFTRRNIPKILIVRVSSVIESEVAVSIVLA